MTQLHLPQSAWDAMTDAEREAFVSQFGDVRLGQPAEAEVDVDGTKVAMAVWDDGRFETVTLRDDKLEAIATELKVPVEKLRAASTAPRKVPPTRT